MEKFTNLQLDEIEKQINKIERNEKNEITKSTQILTFLESKLEELKSFISILKRKRKKFCFSRK